MKRVPKKQRRLLLQREVVKVWVREVPARDLRQVVGGDLTHTLTGQQEPPKSR